MGCSMRKTVAAAPVVLVLPLLLSACAGLGVINPATQADETAACTRMVAEGLRPLADQREDRFNGKVSEAVAQCRGGAQAVQMRKAPTWIGATTTRLAM